jgi:rhamnose utilization protein RhaD (predicted bifunctional aldolase and dehydrogenase)/NAD(P)-dependent dehydrogenase (short-subunit alcohol dehydrogenase family)
MTVSSDLKQLVAASRKLGADPKLVLHGGGNSSLKAWARDIAGRRLDVLYVKGSGRDLAEVEARDFPAVRMEPLLALRDLASLSDADMVRALNGARLDPEAPSPSVETLLHVFLPATFVLHTHADAVLALTNQPNGEKLCREIFGGGLAIAPYAMSGFALAKEAHKLIAKQPDAWGLLVLKHGLFTFGKTAAEAEKRMFDAVAKAERKLRAAPKKFTQKKKTPGAPPIEEIAPVLRGALATRNADDTWNRMVSDFRTSAAIRAFVDGKDLKRYASAGSATPDHVIWTKPKPLILDALPTETAALQSYVRAAVASFGEDYQAYVARNAGRRAEVSAPLDPLPRVALVRGLGLFGLGRTQREAKIAADLAEANVGVITAAEAIGRFAPVGEGDLFDIEYWGPEQAKRERASAKSAPLLQGHIAVVTGAASGIGAATARMFAANGASVAVLDLGLAGAQAVAEEIGGLGLACDVTDRRAVKDAFAAIVRRFGGIDIVVSNAGAAWQGEIGTVADDILRKSFELNFFAHQSIAQEAVAVMRRQKTGGSLLFNTSKQAVNPGANFGPYGLPKAATLFLVRQYALDHGKDGIRANAVNADRIRSGLLTDAMIAQRSAARKVSEDKYMRGNLLGEEVTADDVARAFLHLTLSPKTTAAVLTVDGGNIEAALR